MKTVYLRTYRDRRGFTLVEMLLVLAILALLAGIIYPRLTNRMGSTRISAAKTQMKALSSALQLFEMDNGSFPKGKDGLAQLVQRPPNSPNWQGPYVEKIPTDPWDNAYIFEFPGKHPPFSFDLISAGPDGKSGTEDDIANWK